MGFSIKIVIIAVVRADASKTKIEYIKNIGIEIYIAKPIRVKELKELIEKSAKHIQVL